MSKELDMQLDIERQKRLRSLLAATRPSVVQVQKTQGDGTYQNFLEISFRGSPLPLVPIQANVENYRR